MKRMWLFALVGAAGVLAGGLIAPLMSARAQGPGGQPGGPMQPGMPGMGPMQPGGGMGPMGPGMGPMGPMMSGPAPIMTVTADFVYILRGNMLYQFSAKDLTLVHRAMLPEEPRMGPGAPGMSGAPDGRGGTPGRPGGQGGAPMRE